MPKQLKPEQVVILSLILVIILFNSLTVFATHDDDADDIIYQTETIEITTAAPKIFYGKHIYFLGYSRTAANVKVDGKYAAIPNDNNMHYANGVNLQLLYIREQSKFSNLTAFFNATVSYVCGNNVCEKGESKQICCTDCGCIGTEKCFDNQCIEPWRNQCAKNSECNDNEPCTINLCKNVPRECMYSLITNCVQDDGCCPASCNEADDIDCSKLKQCANDIDCNDNNKGTVDKCSKLTNRCYNVNKNDINSNENVNQAAQAKASETGMKGAKTDPIKDSCRENKDCDDNSDCTDDKCSRLTNQCYYEAKEECKEKNASADGIEGSDDKELGNNKDNNTWKSENSVFAMLALLVLLVVIYSLMKDKG